MKFTLQNVIKIYKNIYNSKTFLILVAILFFNQFSLNAQNELCNSIPDIILHNGTIVMMEPYDPLAESIAIKSDTIMAVGSNDEILDLLSPGCGTKVVDLQGLTILPGFNDSHCHWLSWREHICSVTGDTTYPSLEEIMQMLSANGWTSISELNFGRPDFAPEHFNNAMDLDSQGKLSVRLNGYWGTLDDVSLVQILADSNLTPGSFYSDHVRAPGIKMYVDDPFGTTDILTQDQVNQLVQAAHNAGWQIAAHSVNTSAVEKILTAYENVLGSESNENSRHRIEHAVKVSDAQLNRMAQKGIIASFQLMGPPDWPEQYTFQTYLSNTNADWCLRWNDFIEAEPSGLHNTGSTDAPFNDSPCDYSPFRVIHQAVTRIGHLDRIHADWELAQRLTIENSLKLLTVDGAYTTFEEDLKGSLKPGKWADLVIVSENPSEVTNADDLLDIEIYLTMMGGEIKYCNDIVINYLCSAIETFSIDSALITASKYLEDQTPNLAFDNNIETNWGAGDFAPQWIQIDLLDEFNIAGMDLIIDQWPAGQTIHQIWAKGNDPDAAFELLHEFSGNTEINQTLTYTSPPTLPPYRYFKILTTQSPSWVSWKEIKIFKGVPTSSDKNNIIPAKYTLEQNYPNPFNPTTNFRFRIANFGFVTLKVYDVLGNEVAILINEEKPAGEYKVEFDGSELTSGIYFYQLKSTPIGGQAGGFGSTKKFILIK